MAKNLEDPKEFFEKRNKVEDLGYLTTKFTIKLEYSDHLHVVLA